MERINKRIDVQVQFWLLLGPILILLAAAALLFKVSNHWYFSLGALLGIPLCLKWRLRGVAASIACLGALMTLSYSSIDPDEFYWHVGMSLTMVFSFIVFALSLEEADDVLANASAESKSRLDNIQLLDERWKTAEVEWQSEKSILVADAKALEIEMAKTQEEKAAFYKLAHLAKDEIIQLRSHHEHLLQDLNYKRHQVALLQERLDECEATIQSFVDASPQGEMEKLKAELHQAESKAAQLTEELNMPSEELTDHQRKRIESLYLQLRKQFEDKSAELDRTRQALFTAQETLLVVQRERDEAARAELNDQCAQWEAVVIALEEENKQLKGEVEELYVLMG